MAALRLDASVAATVLVAKAPALELVHEFDPLVPAVTVPQENIPVAFVTAPEKVGLRPG